MPLTEAQKKVRQHHFPGRRGFLPPDQMQLFKQLCHDAGCPLEEGVFKRSRHSPAVKDEAPEWIPDVGLPRNRKTKRKADSLYSYDSSDTERDTSHARAAAAAAAAAAAVPTTGLDLSDRAAAVARSGLLSLGGGSNAGDMQDSGSSGEDLSHKQGRMTHGTNLLQQQHPQPLQLMGYTLDPAAAAAAIRGIDTILLSPHCSTGPNPLGAATSAGMAAANGPAAAAAAAAATMAAAAAAAGRESSGFQARQPAVGTSVGRLSDDAVRGLMHLKTSSPSKQAPASSTAAPSPAAAAAARPVMGQALNLGSFQQQQQPQRTQPQQQQQEEEEEEEVPLPPRQQQQQQQPALTVSTGRGRGRPRGRPPTRGRGRGRPSVKRESEPLAVASPLHPAAAAAAAAAGGGGMYGSGQGYHGSGSAFPSYGLGGQGQSTLARLTHAAAMAEGMGSRGDRSRPDDYYQVYSEYYAAQEAYNRLTSSLAGNPLMHSLPQPELPEKLYGGAYAGRAHDPTGMLAAAASLDLLKPGAVAASRRKRHHTASHHHTGAAAAAAGAEAGQPRATERIDPDEPHSADDLEAAEALAAAAAGPPAAEVGDGAAAADAAAAEGADDTAAAAAAAAAAVPVGFVPVSGTGAAAAAGAEGIRQVDGLAEGSDADVGMGGAGGGGFEPDSQLNDVFHDAHGHSQSYDDLLRNCTMVA